MTMATWTSVSTSTPLIHRVEPAGNYTPHAIWVRLLLNLPAFRFLQVTVLISPLRRISK